jgi:H+-transporting ATPase
MTGDGVNDAPALKRADIGIAVAGATDAARGAADIILTEPGLSVIVHAIIGSRKIFQRMKNYATYSCTTCVRIVTTFALLTLIFDFYFPTLLIVIIAILNDGTIITISKDRVKPSKSPDQWKLGGVFFKALIFGLYLAASSLILFGLADRTNFFSHFALPDLQGDFERLRGVMYMQVSISGAVVIFLTRAHRWFFMERPGILLCIALVFSQVAATLIGVYGFPGYPWGEDMEMKGCGWAWALGVWIWCVIWFIPMDPLKLVTGFVYGKLAPHIPDVHCSLGKLFRGKHGVAAMPLLLKKKKEKPGPNLV